MCFNDAQSAVHPAVLHVVFHENDMCARLQKQLLWRGHTAFGELPGDCAVEADRLSRQLLQLVRVDMVDGVASGRQRDVQVWCLRV